MEFADVFLKCKIRKTCHHFWFLFSIVSDIKKKILVLQISKIHERLGFQKYHLQFKTFSLCFMCPFFLYLTLWNVISRSCAWGENPSKPIYSPRIAELVWMYNWKLTQLIGFQISAITLVTPGRNYGQNYTHKTQVVINPNNGLIFWAGFQLKIWNIAWEEEF